MRDILESNYSMLRIWGSLLIVPSFSFRESSAIVIDIFFFTFITAGLTKQSSAN